MTSPTNPGNSGDRTGPYDHARDAAADARVVVEAARRGDPYTSTSAVAYDRLLAELGRLGVEHGAYDDEVCE